MSSRPTLQDVADAADVSLSTASRALRSHPRISLATRERVQQAATTLGYRPDPLLAALSMRLRGKSSSLDLTTIAYVESSKEAHPYRQAYFAGASARAVELGYRLEHFCLQEGGMTTRRLNQILYARGICGVCIGPLQRPRGHLKMNWEDFACATIGFSMLRPALHRAATNSYQGILLAMRELRRLGYWRIGVYLNDATCKRMDDLPLAGALAYAHRHPKNHHAVLHQEDSEKHARRTALNWFHKQRLDAVIGNLTLKSWLEEEGIRFPEDAGFAASHWFEDHGENAGIDQCSSKVAAAAIDLVVHQIHSNERGIPDKPKTVMLLEEWKPGATVRQR